MSPGTTSSTGMSISRAVAHHARRLRLQAHQRADRVARPPLRARLEHPPEQDQRDDDAGGLEVDRHRRSPAMPAMSASSLVANQRGASGRRHRVEVAAPVPDGDQRVHVRRAVAEGRPRAAVELRAAVKHHRRRQQRAEASSTPGKSSHGMRAVRHRDHQHRQRQDRRDPELAPKSAYSASRALCSRSSASARRSGAFSMW